MGGPIAFTLRLPSGREHRMHVGVHRAAWMVRHIGLIRQDPVHLAQLVAAWEYDKELWAIAKALQERPWCGYSPSLGLAPSSYGAVVVDCRSKTILATEALGGYTDLTRIQPLFGYPDGWQERCGDDVEVVAGHDALAVFAGLFLGGAVVARELGRSHSSGRRVLGRFPVPAGPRDMAALRREVESAMVLSLPHSTIFHGWIMEYPGWTLREFPWSADGTAALRDAVLAMGFVLTDHEAHGWEQAILERSPVDIDDGFADPR